MPWAEFEEKEYEAPLYNQLEAAHPNVWSPGQVFEHRIGIDRGILVSDLRFWKHIGFNAVRRGHVLSRRSFSRLPQRLQRALPDFRMNVFIQAKRCQRLQRVPRSVQDLGVKPPSYRFSIESDQRDVLAAVASELGYHSYVCYAAPAFHTLDQLFFHTTRGDVITHSTFPSAKSLSDHELWYYNDPGGHGVAASAPEYIDDNGLLRMIQEISRRAPEGVASAAESLTTLARQIDSAFESIETPADRRRAVYDEEVRSLARQAERYDWLDDGILSFLKVGLFTEHYNLSWYPIGRGAQ